MGALWLPGLPDWLSSAGLRVRTWPGWLTRSRSSGGYDDIFAIGIHHDAGHPSQTTDGRCRYEWEVAANRPIGALHLGADGEWVVGAAGATNTQGRGGPYQCSRGTIPLDSGNRYTISVEASNNGTGQPWSQAQREAYVEGCAAIIEGLARDGAFDARYGNQKRIQLDPLRDVIAHFEWTTRKIDPAGPPSPYARANDQYLRWDMGRFRSDVAAAMTIDPPTGGGPVTVTADNTVYFDEGIRVYDSRESEPVHHNPNTKKGKLQPGEIRKVAVAMATAVTLRITVVGAEGKGWLMATGSPRAGQIPDVNFRPETEPCYDTVPRACPDGHVYVHLPPQFRPVHFIIDVMAQGG
jgi:hypothetical protein